MRPDRIVVEAYLLRGFRLWIVARALIRLVMLWGSVNPFQMTVSSAIEIVVLSVLICFLETHRHRERALLANLAIRPSLLASGTVHFAGHAYLSARLRGLAARGLFYLPDHDFLSTAFTVRQQLEMIRRQFDGGNVVDAAERLGIASHLDKRPFELSGGERRRAELAAIVVRRPLCLLADEPYRGVSPRDAEALTATFATLLEAADHVGWCTIGTTYELGPPSTAVQNERFRREYLGAGFRSN